jgi:transcriptional regulator with XRE-family HTH domain
LVGPAVRKCRLGLGLSIPAFAARCGAAVSTLKRIEYGQGCPGDALAERLRRLGVELPAGFEPRKRNHRKEQAC